MAERPPHLDQAPQCILHTDTLAGRASDTLNVLLPRPPTRFIDCGVKIFLPLIGADNDFFHGLQETAAIDSVGGAPTDVAAQKAHTRMSLDAPHPTLRIEDELSMCI